MTLYHGSTVEVVSPAIIEVSLAWLDMVVRCRSSLAYRHGYDVMFGKIANDNVGETFVQSYEVVVRQ